ncbi:MAG: class I SAM-dependent methyltransferase [Pelagimonas sp.]|jgi:SAM-dependent methyltransferase|nr:class I SAM-dependent methyltransferase [Pelagimonas sp.]
MTDAPAFWNKIAQKYAARPVGDQAAYEATLDRVRHWLTAQMRVLELGCGTGSTAVTLAPHVGEMVGTDFAAEMIAIAQAKIGDQPNLRFEVAQAAQAGGTDRYDAVLGFNLFHLVDDPAATFAHIHDMLADGGLFISKTPALGHKWFLWPLVRGMQLVGKAPKPVFFWRSTKIEEMIAQAGFEIMETGDYPKSLPSHFVVARKI